MPAGITISYKKEGNISFLTLSWEIDQLQLPKTFSDAYNAVSEFENILLLLDLSGIQYINSGFIGNMAELFSIVDENGGKMVVVANAALQEAFNLVGFTEFVTVVSSPVDALRELSAR